MLSYSCDVCTADLQGSTQAGSLPSLCLQPPATWTDPGHLHKRMAFLDAYADIRGQLASHNVRQVRMPPLRNVAAKAAGTPWFKRMNSQQASRCIRYRMVTAKQRIAQPLAHLLSLALFWFHGACGLTTVALWLRTLICRSQHKLSTSLIQIQLDFLCLSQY